MPHNAKILIWVVGGSMLVAAMIAIAVVAPPVARVTLALVLLPLLAMAASSLAGQAQRLPLHTSSLVARR